MPSFDIHAFLEQFKYDPENPLLFNNGFFVFFFTVFIALYYRFRNNLRRGGISSAFSPFTFFIRPAMSLYYW